jgi:hypothetical protein
MMNQVLGRRGWLNTIFDKVVEHQHLPRMSAYLDEVVMRGNRLTAFIHASRSAASSRSLA